MTTSDIYINLVENQKVYDRNHFTSWCYNLFELNERLHIEMSMSNKLYVNNNGYMIRSYFVVLWEVIYNGKKYIEMQNDKKEKHLAVIGKLIDVILKNCSDDDYFMINYYRNCASHIFLTRYSVLNEKGNQKEEAKETKFFFKQGDSFSLTYDGILQKVEKVFGGKLGVDLEPKYKKNLLNRLYPIIHKYSIKISKIDDKNANVFYERIFTKS